ncbi:ATP-binding protein [Mesorhizobium sp. YC-39]|uniref:ATP-binding protein n=1 Tax=unclassified Mesorhizobium TaxID=325217 RepID=UPI0021E967A9|nr:MULTISPECIES: ATP-binding protein [unclassified Mesorhizobium]MCV3211091.1 ATP-binding protein [Mesorhizobium sp. YC-2]MCV3232816.1 ATP-binding protein [Mesorhizobium sp. YC-39]
MSFDVIPQSLSITAMRSSGYRDSAHAIAELIDNSAQAGDATAGTTHVELICLDRAQAENGRKRIDSIAVFDDAAGMSPDLLRKAMQFGNGTHLEKKNQKGIGKFGMGLPNSSISQCKRVDVWSWQNGKVFHTFLDVDKIEKSIMKEVPEPTASTIPSEWLKMISAEIQPHGTLVVWSQLDRVSWKQSSTLLKHTEFITGRVYRHFIDQKAVQIRLAAYAASGDRFISSFESLVRPNDPLYLMTGANAPEPYNKTPAFVNFAEPMNISVGFRGEDHVVQVRTSICTEKVRIEGGGSKIGQHAAKNQGISVVRSGRELELSRTFENSYDPRERYWGLEVEFDPNLDDVFGVTNNKQAATNFLRRNLSEDAADEGMSDSAYQNMLESDQDPRMPMYLISAEIDKLLVKMRQKIATMRERTRVEKKSAPTESQAEAVATESVNRRRAYYGDTGQSDKQEESPESARMEALSANLESDGIEGVKAKEIAVEYVKKHIKFRFKHLDLPTDAFFDVNATGGVIVITLNTRNPVHARLFEPMRADDLNNEIPYLTDVLHLLSAWARMEDEASGPTLKRIQDMRSDWGRIVRGFFSGEEL